MNSKIFYYFLVGGLTLAAIIGLVAFYYVAFGNLDGLFPPFFQKLIPSQTTPPTSNKPLSTGPEITISVDSDRHLILSWKNLPPAVRDIHILRAREGQPKWSLWKTISISNLREGTIQLQATFSQGLLSYIYYFEGIGENGQTLWTSSSTSIVAFNQSPPSSSGSPTPPSQQNNQSQTPPTPAATTTTNPSLPPSSSTTSGSPSSTEPPNTIIYYTPQGDISGSAPLTSESFWVKEVNKKIQIGWVSLNPSSTEVVVLRASSESGPWLVLFRQSQPITQGPYSIFIVDDALTQTAFYKLNSLSASGEILNTFGPVVFHPSGL
jgi:hypothetical protein